MSTMKAVRFHEYGEPTVLRYEDAPRPKPANGEVLVKVHATSVNPVDCAIRAGHFRALREYPLPFILGWDFSGVIEAVGDGVDRNQADGRSKLRDLFRHSLPPGVGEAGQAEAHQVSDEVCELLL